eukprot:TRINITY_DN19442_c0_g1_i1.p2 TRINITY_DN19442_c0_g1~~TRINITY_DN19442_c0_g1_i1.p2  ORF type:complete len:333 (+),score=78.26 TRINITY_DN19442_c0_g1_i1:80-1000(+)
MADAAGGGGEGLPIYVQYLDATHSVEVSPDALVSDVMAELERITGVQQAVQKLCFQGEALAPDVALADAGVSPQAMLELTLRLALRFDTATARRGQCTKFEFEGAALSSISYPSAGAYWAGALSELPLGTAQGGVIRGAFRVDMTGQTPSHSGFAVGLISDEGSAKLNRFLLRADPFQQPQPVHGLAHAQQTEGSYPRYCFVVGQRRPLGDSAVHAALFCGNDRADQDVGAAFAKPAEMNGMRIGVELRTDTGEICISKRKGPRGEVEQVTVLSDGRWRRPEQGLHLHAVAFCQSTNVRVLLRPDI